MRHSKYVDHVHGAQNQYAGAILRLSASIDHGLRTYVVEGYAEWRWKVVLCW